MAKQRLLYIEEKTGPHGDRGPAWIGRATFSRSGRTVYFNGRAMKRAGGRAISGNHICIETGDEFWISGVKKNGEDRHWAGGGPIQIDARVVEEYLEFRGLEELDPGQYEVVTDIVETDIQKFTAIENRSP